MHLTHVKATDWATLRVYLSFKSQREINSPMAIKTAIPFPFLSLPYTCEIWYLNGVRVENS